MGRQGRGGGDEYGRKVRGKRKMRSMRGRKRKRGKAKMSRWYERRVE